MYKFDTKFKQEKIESILKENNILFESNENGTYFSKVEAYGKKISLDISVYKSSITIRKIHGYWAGITSYKKLKEVIAFEIKDIKSTIWERMSMAEKVAYRAIEEYNEKGTTEFVDGFVNATINNINSNIKKISKLLD